MEAGDRVCCRGKPGTFVGEVVSVSVKVKFPDGTRSFAPEDLRVAPALPAPGRPVAASGRKRKAYDVVCDYIHSTDCGGNEKDIASLNKRFRSLDAAATAVAEFYDMQSSMEIDKDEVVQKLRQDGSWDDEQIQHDESGRYHHDEGACYVMHASICVVQ
ncbi:unnamed protein product [Polarella glacialis]|uniref:Uncharacterized protein n=1 Tax=Polarella glacialis TaxID=89957 RepID=A0A813KYE3_POLGL|nr:unnamed protein product [Polarella glacialis]CAE8711193.1 unnamed protein product [Polarella glacialis]